MNNVPVNEVLNFLYSIFSKLFSFINANSIVKWFVFIPIAAGFLCVIFYFVFDVSHIFDDYKARHRKYYKVKNNDYNNRRYKNKNPVMYGEFKKQYSDAPKVYRAKNYKPSPYKAKPESAKFKRQFDIKYEDE